MKKILALTDFLNLSIGPVIDAYLRDLALGAVKSSNLTQMAEQLGGCQCGLAKVDAQKGKLIEDRYWVAGDGTVTDQQTRLMWMQSPLPEMFTFANAQEAAKNLNVKSGFAGYADWRVPTKKELMSLVVECSYPSICQEAFPGTPQTGFWTSTPITADCSSAWAVCFGYGSACGGDKLLFNHVRLVRNLIFSRI